MDTYVWDFVRDVCHKPEMIREAINRKVAELEAMQGDLEAEVEEMQQAIDELITERQWVITQARRGKITEDDMDQQLGALQF